MALSTTLTIGLALAMGWSVLANRRLGEAKRSAAEAAADRTKRCSEDDVRRKDLRQDDGDPDGTRSCGTGDRARDAPACGPPPLRKPPPAAAVAATSTTSQADAEALRERH